MQFKKALEKLMNDRGLNIKEALDTVVAEEDGRPPKTRMSGRKYAKRKSRQRMAKNSRKRNRR